ncbi:AbgT family transporter [Bengtsoniella intestinalis]|uniref:AbgT family transporter n=1 Tax=Bengtsoniella intestinalis TaxID=3073143 RepID=UPI00391F2B7F
MSGSKLPHKPSLMGKFLNTIEAVGNKLPHPIALFAWLSVLMVVISMVCSWLGVSATGTLVVSGVLAETTVETVNLFTAEGLAWMLTSAVTNFTSYAPLGTVLVAMLGVGVAEHSGLISAVLKRTVQITPKSLICPVVVFLGVMSNITSDAGYVVLIPLGAMVFRAYGRHPMAGLAAAFAGVSGGFSANLMVGVLDPMLQGISQEAAYLVDPNYQVNIMGNYYFLFVSTFLITILGTLVTDYIVEPRLGKFDQAVLGEDDTLRSLTDAERSGLKVAGIAFWGFALVVVGLCIPANSFLRASDGSLTGSGSVLIGGIIVLIALFFMIPAIAYGKKAGTMTNTVAVCNSLCKSMESMGPFVALAFVASQFIAYFNYTKLGTILAINGAHVLGELNIGLIPLMVLFVLFSAFINLFMGSASAKWNIMAPVFVPMFMMLGYSPELAQLAYRIGDSSTNLITPLMSHFAIILIFAQKYDKKAGLGTLTATMLPYSIAFLVCWTVMMIIWLALGLPIGVDTGLFYTPVV